MQIFQQEKNDGLEELLRSSASVSYASFAEPCNYNKSNIKTFKSIASINDSDLYYVQSILVSSSWNKNDDIFDKIEVWNAKNTPEDKPTNLEHDESIIIGHITSNWPITEEGILIDPDTPVENLPEKYHILTGSVIYKGFSDPALRQRSEKLIGEIQSGTKYVSMECFFKGFDYGLINESNGEYKILARNNDTAYLTRHLRAYGGTGNHENYKIGRVLRNITFTGKGFVDKPANSDSIIFNKNILSEQMVEASQTDSTEKNDKIIISGVSISQANIKSENNIMSSETPVVESQNTEAKSECAEAVALASTLTEELNALKASNEKLEATVAELTSAKETELTSLKTEAEAKVKELETSLAKLQSDLDAANETIAGYKDKEMQMMKQEKKMKRKATLIENGFDTETAASIVDKFENMEDDTFDAVTTLFAGKMPPWLEKIKKGDKPAEEEMKDKKKASEEATDPAILETVEVEPEVNLSVGGEIESEVDSTRAALVEFVRSRIGKSTK